VASKRLDDLAEQRFWLGVRAAEKFFMGVAEVQKALNKLVEILEEERIPYAIVGAMALNEFGYRRVTVDVDVLLTADGLAAFKAKHLGRGYIEKFPGSRGVRDPEHGVDIDVVLAGTYPGDGKLKLASGLTAPDRLKDLADVQELIRIRQLPRTLEAEIDPFVRDKYLELWRAVQHRSDE
jgi:hypothetical protein